LVSTSIGPLAGAIWRGCRAADQGLASAQAALRKMEASGRGEQERARWFKHTYESRARSCPKRRSTFCPALSNLVLVA